MFLFGGECCRGVSFCLIVSVRVGVRFRVILFCVGVGVVVGVCSGVGAGVGVNIGAGVGVRVDVGVGFGHWYTSIGVIIGSVLGLRRCLVIFVCRRFGVWRFGVILFEIGVGVVVGVRAGAGASVGVSIVAGVGVCVGAEVSVGVRVVIVGVVGAVRVAILTQYSISVIVNTTS